jgi:anionic cell wall polymer biosynthesis LytR-Cps2A-Psr (LCP) family protein
LLNCEQLLNLLYYVIMLKFFKTIGLALLILGGIFCLAGLIPASSIELSSTQEEVVQQKKNGFLKTISSLFSNKDNQFNQQNILLLGQPGPGYLAADLTDTIILAHLNLIQTTDENQSASKRKITLISLPRDLLVKIPEQEVAEITGLTVDHYLTVDLTVVEKIITLVDGLNIYVSEDINDPYFPGPNYTYQVFNLAAGWRYLDGPTTLKYIRTRYTSANGDFDRMARQQQVIHLLKQKVLDLNPLWDWPTYLKIFQQLKTHLKTDLSLLEMKSLYQIAKEMEADQINHLVIDKKETGLLTGGLVPFGQQMASVVYPKAGQGNYDQIKEYIEKTINNN